MISPSLTDTELRLDKGRATVEVAELHQGNNLVITLHGDAVRLLKTGLYDFDADHNLVRVFQGEAVVREMKRDVKLRAIVRSRSETAVRRRPRNSTKNKLRTISTAGAACGLRIPRKLTSNRAQNYTMGGWYGAGWDWDPYYSCYTYIPGDGIFYSPFGWGFYSPFFVGFAPFGFFGHFHHDFDDFRHFEGRERGDRGHFGDRGGTLVVGRVVRLTTTTTSITAPTMGLTIPAAAAWATAVAKAFAVAKAPMVAEAFMVAKAFMAAKAPMVVEAFTVAEAVTVAEASRWRRGRPSLRPDPRHANKVGRESAPLFCATCEIQAEEASGGSLISCPNH